MYCVLGSNCKTIQSKATFFPLSLLFFHLSLYPISLPFPYIPLCVCFYQIKKLGNWAMHLKQFESQTGVFIERSVCPQSDSLPV